MHWSHGNYGSRDPKYHKKIRGQHSKAAAPWSGTLKRHPAAAPATKLQSANSALTAAPCSGRHKQQSSKRKQHSDSSVLQRHSAAALCSGTLLCSGTSGTPQSALQRHPAAAQATKLQSANSTLTAAPCSGASNQAPKVTLKQHQAAPCSGTGSGTNMPAPKRRLEVKTPIASLSGENPSADLFSRL